jgi:hypothetical protein
MASSSRRTRSELSDQSVSAERGGELRGGEDRVAALGAETATPEEGVDHRTQLDRTLGAVEAAQDHDRRVGELAP